jgi:thiol-disulfide isomerase/thioredoxin
VPGLWSARGAGEQLRRGGRFLAAVAALALLGAGCRGGGAASAAPAGSARTARAGSEYLQSLYLPSVNRPWAPAELQDRVVVVAFFATWCFPCLAEMPMLERLQDELGPKGLQVIGVGMDLEGAQVLAPFAEHYGLRFPVLEADRALIEGRSAYGTVQALPTVAVLDRRGRLVDAWTGVLGEDEVAERVRKALGR